MDLIVVLITFDAARDELLVDYLDDLGEHDCSRSCHPGVEPFLGAGCIPEVEIRHTRFLALPAYTEHQPEVSSDNNPTPVRQDGVRTDPPYLPTAAHFSIAAPFPPSGVPKSLLPLGPGKRDRLRFARTGRNMPVIAR